MPRFELEDAVRAKLYETLAEEPAVASVLILKTCNRFNPLQAERIDRCAQILSTYLENLIQHPKEEKYRRIRFEARTFQESVVALEGAVRFLEHVGFRRTKLPRQNSQQQQQQPDTAGVTSTSSASRAPPEQSDVEDYYVIGAQEAENSERLGELKRTLAEAEPVAMELERDTTVYDLSSAESSASFAQLQLPDEFYRLSRDEVKREQDRRETLADEMQQLKLRRSVPPAQRQFYPFTLIRVRFPGDLLLQGVPKASCCVASFSYITCTALGHSVFTRAQLNVIFV